jgi:hypothetical protein
MNRWFEFTETPDGKIMGGKEEQTKAFIGQADDLRFEINSLNYCEPYKGELTFDCIEMYPSSKKTDIIWDYKLGRVGKLISIKLFNILLDHRILNPEYIDAKLVFKNEVLDYKYMRILEGSNNMIDFINSKIYFSGQATKIKVHSDAELAKYKQLIKNDFQKNIFKHKIIVEEVILESKFIDLNYDLFKVPLLNTCMMIGSERLRESIISNKVSGFDFERRFFSIDQIVDI